MQNILRLVYSLKLKSIILFLTRGLVFIFFSNGHIHNVVSTLSNVMKIYVVVDVFLTLPNVVQINLEIDNVDSNDVFQRCEFQRLSTQRCFNVGLTLCDVATSYQPKHNVETTLKCLLGIKRLTRNCMFF